MRAWIVAALLPITAFAGDRLSTLTVNQDNQYTALSTITCKIIAARLTKGRTYSGEVFFQWESNNPSQNGYSFTVPYEVSPTVPTYTDGYGLTATLSPYARLVVTLKVQVPLSPADVVYCNGRVDSGAAASPGGTVYAADMRYVERTP
jgi:hypothetical protein